MVVVAQGEGEGAAREHIAAGHGPALPGGIELPGLRGQLGSSAHRGFDDEVAGRVQAQGAGPVVAQGHAGGVGARGQQHIVFELLARIFIQSQVDARPQAGVAQPPKRAHVAGPAPAVVANEVVALASRGRLGREAGAGAGLLEVHGIGVGRDAVGFGRAGGGAGRAVVVVQGGGVQEDVGEGRGQHEQRTGRQVGLVAHAAIPLAFVLHKFEAGAGGGSGRAPCCQCWVREGSTTY